MTGYLDRLECSLCAAVRPFGPAPAGLCGCGAPLLARYRLEEVRKALRREDLRGRVASLWRYHEVLPAVPPITLGEGFTPLLPAGRLGRELGLRELLIKDESVNPTGSFKARGMAVAVSVAVAQGVKVGATPSAGNAGSALAAYGGRAGLEVHLFLPESTPRPFILEARRLGARVRLVAGSIADAGRVMRETLGQGGWFDFATLREPFRIEGKKTMGYELAEQNGFELPDVVIYPTGGGTGLIGIWKAFDEMEALGWIGRRRPRMIAVQAEGCAPIVKAFESGAPRAMPWPAPETAAAGLRVPGSLGDFLILRAVRDSGGTALAVTDREMMEGCARLARLEGIDACPEGGATVAALSRLMKEGTIGTGERVVLLNTGTGLKYFDREPGFEPGQNQ